MKINWTVRLKNKVWLATFLSFIVSTVYQWLGYFDIAPVVTQDAVLQLVTAVANEMFPKNRGVITSIVMISSSVANYIVVSVAGVLTRVGGANGPRLVVLFNMAVTLVGTSYHASCFVGINRGAGDSRFVMMVDLICGWLVVLPLSYLAAFVLGWPPAAVYFCTRIDQCYKWIIAFFRLRGNKWIKNVTREDAMEAQS